MVNKRQGRPRGKSGARDNILRAAQKHFLEAGYKETSVRKIAAEAGVDHSLVNYYFGTKENLFSEAVLGGFSPAVVFKAVRAVPGLSLANFPRLLAGAFVTLCETPTFQNNVIPTLEFALEDEEARKLVTGYMEREVLEEAEALFLELKSRTPRPASSSARETAISVSTILLGALVSRYILRIGPHAAAPPKDFRKITERLLRGALN